MRWFTLHARSIYLPLVADAARAATIAATVEATKSRQRVCLSCGRVPAHPLVALDVAVRHLDDAMLTAHEAGIVRERRYFPVGTRCLSSSNQLMTATRLVGNESVLLLTIMNWLPSPVMS